MRHTLVYEISGALSDAQELLSRGHQAEANDLINYAKSCIFEFCDHNQTITEEQFQEHYKQFNEWKAKRDAKVAELKAKGIEV